MKRNLLQNVKIQPYASDEVVDKNGYLSAILGAKVSAAGKLTITVTHGDTEEAADTVTDTRVFPETETENGVYETEELEAGSVVNIDIDLLGLKNFVKIAVSGATATCALALGDNRIEAV